MHFKVDPGVSIIFVACGKKNSSNMYMISQPCSCKLQFLVIEQHCSDVMVGFKCNLHVYLTNSSLLVVSFVMENS